MPAERWVLTEYDIITELIGIKIMYISQTKTTNQHILLNSQ